ncbi:MAG: type II toxin-antitoxin system RelE/ParE family toxin [Bacteroidota bacterium]
MVGQIFRVFFSKKAQRRRQLISDFEKQSANAKKARKVQREIDKAARKLDKLPNANPIYQEDEDGTIFRYVKAFKYKLIFKVFEKAKEVFIVTVRHDAEDPDTVERDLK